MARKSWGYIEYLVVEYLSLVVEYLSLVVEYLSAKSWGMSTRCPKRSWGMRVQDARKGDEVDDASDYFDGQVEGDVGERGGVLLDALVRVVELSFHLEVVEAAIGLPHV